MRIILMFAECRFTGNDKEWILARLKISNFREMFLTGGFSLLLKYPDEL